MKTFFTLLVYKISECGVCVHESSFHERRGLEKLWSVTAWLSFVKDLAAHSSVRPFIASSQVQPKNRYACKDTQTSFMSLPRGDKCAPIT
jgi:hypothetical protein